MSDLAARIEKLDAATAERVLTAVARYRVSRGLAADLQPDAALAADLAGTAPDAAVSAGDLAKAGLLLLADDPDMVPVLESMIEHPPAESYEVVTGILVGTAALVALQSYVKIERDKSGTWTFKFERKPMSDALLKQLIGKLGGWVGKAG